MQSGFTELIYHKAEARRQIRQEIKEDRIRFVNML